MSDNVVPIPKRNGADDPPPIPPDQQAVAQVAFLAAQLDVHMVALRAAVEKLPFGCAISDPRSGAVAEHTEAMWADAIAMTNHLMGVDGGGEAS